MFYMELFRTKKTPGKAHKECKQCLYCMEAEDKIYICKYHGKGIPSHLIEDGRWACSNFNRKG